MPILRSPPPAKSATLRLAFAPNLEAARAVAVSIRGFLADQGIPETELLTYELCVAEAGYNAVEHATGPARKLEPVAEALFTVDQVELRLTDHTPGFVFPESILEPPPGSERGRGLFVINSVMDEVRYLRGARENVLIMRKRRRASQPPGAARREAGPAPLSLKESRRQLTESKTARAGLVDELLFHTNALAAVFRCCAELGRHDAVSSGFSKRLLSDLFRITTADWCVLRLLSGDDRELAVAAASDSEASLAALPMLGPAPRGIEFTVADSRREVRFDLSDDANPAEPLRVVGPEATGFVCPLVFGDTLVGTLAVGRRAGDFPLGKLQEQFVRVFAEFLAIQKSNLRHHREQARNQVLGRELEIAQEIQRLLLPQALPQLGGFSLAGGWHCAREVGGDFYDAMAVGDRSLFLIIADVMGKGVPAALFAATMRGLLRGLAAQSDDPAAILGGLNRLLYADLSAVNMFITVQVIHVDLQTRKVTVASAGHCPPLYVPTGRRTVRALAASGLPIGVRPDSAYLSASAILGKPTTLLLHTDGLTDVRNASGQLFGQHRLVGWLSANALSGHTAAELRDRLSDELRRFRGDAPMADDQAFLLLTESHGSRA